MCWPSGDHSGLLRSLPSEVICLGAPPVIGATYSSFGVPGSAFAPWRYTMLFRPSGEYEGGKGLMPMSHSPCAKTTKPPRTSANRASAPTTHNLVGRRAVDGREWAVSDRAGEAVVAVSGRAGLERAPRAL